MALFGFSSHSAVLQQIQAVNRIIYPEKNPANVVKIFTNSNVL